jgi:CHAD domain-containing protein
VTEGATVAHEQAIARDVLTRAMVSAVTELEGFEGGIRVNASDALHQARTRVRRMRSILSVYSGVFEPGARRALRSRLAELGDLLGTARDDEVRAAALQERWEAADDEITGAALHLLAEDASAAAALSRATVLEVVDSPRHRALLADLRGFVGHASAGLDAAGPITTLARRSLQRAGRVVRRAADVAASTDDLDDLHAVRKAARRVRYASEAVQQDVQGASALSASAEAVQDALGDHRDALLLAEELRSWSTHSQDASSATVRELAESIEREAGDRLIGLDALVSAIGRAAERLG